MSISNPVSKSVFSVPRKMLFRVLVLTLFFLPLRVFAFDPGSILSDREFTDTKSTSLDFLTRFFNNRAGRLASFRTFGPEGVLMGAAEIIYRSALTYSINPKVLIVTLQKESSAVTQFMTDEQLDGFIMGFGVCDSCSKDDPEVAKYKGFSNQIESATRQFRRYLDEPDKFRHQVGGTYNIDGQEVIVKNKASAALLNYTPHIHGNELFRTLWNRWFLQRYGNGSLLQLEGQPGIYLVQDNTLRPFLNKSAFLANYDFKDVVVISRAEVDAYEVGSSIQFPETALLQDAKTGGIFLHVQNTKRPIVSKEVFQKLGFNPEEIIVVPPSDLTDIPDGEKITHADNFPLGALLQSKKTGGIMYIENNIAHPIYAPEILKNRFKNRSILPVNHDDFEQYSVGDPVKFRDGALITSLRYRAVFIIVNGERHPFPSREVFESLGYQWKSVIRTTDRAVEIHPEGSPISLE